MDDGSIFMIVALVILIGMSAFFSAAETAYNSLNQIRLKSKADDGDRQAAKVLGLVQRYDSLLSTILIGNNIVNMRPRLPPYCSAAWWAIPTALRFPPLS